MRPGLVAKDVAKGVQRVGLIRTMPASVAIAAVTAAVAGILVVSAAAVPPHVHPAAVTSDRDSTIMPAHAPAATMTSPTAAVSAVRIVRGMPASAAMLGKEDRGGNRKQGKGKNGERWRFHRYVSIVVAGGSGRASVVVSTTFHQSAASSPHPFGKSARFLQRVRHAAGYATASAARESLGD